MANASAPSLKSGSDIGLLNNDVDWMRLDQTLGRDGNLRKSDDVALETIATANKALP